MVKVMEIKWENNDTKNDLNKHSMNKYMFELRYAIFYFKNGMSKTI